MTQPVLARLHRGCRVRSHQGAAQPPCCSSAHRGRVTTVEQRGGNACRSRPWPPPPACCACLRYRRRMPLPPAIASTCGVTRSTCAIGVAAGSRRGSALYSASTSEAISSRSASTSAATIAARLSLSPSFSSSTATVSFSLITGNAPSASNSAQGGARVEVAAAISQVVVGQQHLRHTARDSAIATTRSPAPGPAQPAPDARPGHPWPLPRARSSARPAATAPDDTSDHLATQRMAGRDESRQRLGVTRHRAHRHRRPAGCCRP